MRFENNLAEYSLVEFGEKILEGIAYTSFGILGRTKNQLEVIEDISSNRELVTGICNLLNKGEVSIYHFKEVVEDRLFAEVYAG